MRNLICRIVAAVIAFPTAAAVTDNESIDHLIGQIAEIRKEYGVAAVGLALVRGDTVLYSGGFGVLDLDKGEAVNADTQFRVGSITKSFTGLTALRLTRKHNNFLELPANGVIDHVLQDPFAGPPVTLQSLLEHTAGLNDLSQAEFDVQDADVTFAEALKVAPQTRVLKWPANRHSSYSNAGYGIAGYMLEKVLDTPYEVLVHEQVLTPLNMNSSGFYPADGGPPLATGYGSDGVSRLPYWHMIYRSFGGLNSTPRDMARFLSALLTAGTDESAWLTTKERRRFENPQTTLGALTGLEYGYGLGNYHWFRKGARFHGHGGDADGYLSHYGYNHESGLGYFVVITAFRHEPLREIRDDLEDFIARQAQSARSESQNLEPATAPSESQNPEPAQLKQWLGTYAPVTQRFGGSPTGAATLEIRLANGQLETRHKDVQHALIAVSKTHFRRAWQPHATYAFIIDGNDTYLQGDLGNFKKTGSRNR